jgi:hypothetical protein
MIYKKLEDYGFDSHGNEILYNGYNGKQIATEIFIGPTFYFRLKHMVDDKINSRGLDMDKNELPKIMLTRQPTSGRRKGGGLRIGEMERDSILGHGTSLFIKESMMERSDMYSWAVCKKCGVPSIYNPSKKNRIIKCKLCNDDDIVVVNAPYSFKLLSQELESMGISMRLNTENITLPYEQGIDNCITENTFDSYGNILDINEKLPEIVEEQFIQGGEGNDVELYSDEQFMQGGDDKSIQDNSLDGGEYNEQSLDGSDDSDNNEHSFDGSDGGEYNEHSYGGDGGNEDNEHSYGGDGGEYNEHSLDDDGGNEDNEHSYGSDGGENYEHSLDGSDGGEYNEHSYGSDGGNEDYEQSIDGGQLNNEIKTIIIT